MGSNSKIACTTTLHYVFPQHNFFLRHGFTDLIRDLTWIAMPRNRTILFLKKKKKGSQKAVHSRPGGTQELETGVLRGQPG